ncbi:MAG TPA: L-glutamate gamma-semialdehyde dehydrogenase [Planctomycetota bacterium]|nr:1-pyrroline-5-carboxylate dehydrogenase [Planctomycetota bacterium]HJM38902.1 L-glutamate gamma-semialdehyde dehydrogenase [Planctomycetota bacterium]|tara:strand:- start:15256 stop:16827 length:1572 start_codon:yes stop_codon:yes gene_type:complete
MLTSSHEITTFHNEPFTDFSKEEHSSAFGEALNKVEASFPVVVRLWIDGEEKEGGSGTFESLDPSQTSRVVANSAKGSREDALSAIAGAHKAFGEWSQRSCEERAEFLFKAAEIMRLRKHEFSAMMVYEAGKNWAEADGDTAEAIDFLEFYAREALRYGGKQPIVPCQGENNELVYIPLGVGAVIPPWNFPLAILVGMTCAALVTGNTVVLKPSSDTPGIASMFVDLMKEIGLPAGVLQFVPGSGSEVGNAIVEHALTRFISFTGSAEVGMGIYEKAGKVVEGQVWLKRVVAEMGGKDFMFLDEDADIDKAVPATHSAAFGYQGQKCSACSRLILHEKIHDQFMEKFLPLVEATVSGHPSSPSNYLAAMVNESARQTALDGIEGAKKDGNTLVSGGEVGEGEGWYLQPTVFTGVGRDDTIWKEELFAPVLAVHKVSSFEEGIDAANDTIFGLTGAYWGKDEEKIATAKRNLHCGNLYINRKCTGALVGAHPFGGFNMSGTDSKAGGRDYLLLFLQGKTISRSK